ncbi:MAG: hypothetical protein ACRC7O_18100 [Fimbriiglobus sp.]
MTYRDFTYPEVEVALGLTVRELDLFRDVPPLEPPPEFASLIADGVPLALAMHTEKARSDLIISQVLFGLRRMLPERFGLFSGVAFNVDPARGLAGVCDFLMTRSTRQLVVESPVVAVAEAKNETTRDGLGQCIAAMVAAREFNAQKGEPVLPVFGASTTGSEWRFLRLLGDHLVIDAPEYQIDNLPKILGILKVCVRNELPAIP